MTHSPSRGLAVTMADRAVTSVAVVDFAFRGYRAETETLVAAMSSRPVAARMETIDAAVGRYLA